MAKLKGYEELNKKLLNVFKPFGIKEVKFNKEFAWWRGTNTITYDIEMSDIHGDWFEEFVEERFNYNETTKRNIEYFKQWLESEVRE